MQIRRLNGFIFRQITINCLILLISDCITSYKKELNMCSMFYKHFVILRFWFWHFLVGSTGTVILELTQSSWCWSWRWGFKLNCRLLGLKLYKCLKAMNVFVPCQKLVTKGYIFNLITFSGLNYIWNMSPNLMTMVMEIAMFLIILFILFIFLIAIITYFLLLVRRSGGNKFHTIYYIQSINSSRRGCQQPVRFWV